MKAITRINKLRAEILSAKPSNSVAAFAAIVVDDILRGPPYYEERLAIRHAFDKARAARKKTMSTMMTRKMQAALLEVWLAELEVVFLRSDEATQRQIIKSVILRCRDIAQLKQPAGAVGAIQ